MYTLLINNVDRTSELQLNDSGIIDDASIVLDSGVITLINSSANPEPRFTRVKTVITKNGVTITNYFLTDGDRKEEISRVGTKYKHIIGIIEQTKMLEKKIGSLSFKQPADGTTRWNLLQAVQRIFKQIMNIDSVVIESSLSTLLANTRASEQFFKELTAKEMLDIYFDQINAHVRYEYNGTNDMLYADFYNKKGSSVNSSTYDMIEEETSIDEYATKSITTLKNATNDDQEVVYPSLSGWGSLRSETVEFTATTAILDVGDPIDDIIKVIAYFKDGSNNYEEYDITQYVVEKAEWETLKWATTQGTVVKKRSLRYTRGSSIIDNFYRSGSIFEDENPIELIQAQVMSPATSGGTVFNACYIRVFYRPFMDVKLETERDDTTTINKDTQLIINQQAEVLDLNRASKNTWNNLQRVGTKQFITTEVINDLTKLKNVYDYDGDFTISARELNFQFDHLIVKYKWTKNFVQLQKQVSVDSKKRFYNIPREYIDRNIILKDYIKLSYSDFTDDALYIETAGTQTALNIFDGDVNYDKKAKNYAFTNLYGISGDNTLGGNNKYWASSKSVNLFNTFIDNQRALDRISSENSNVIDFIRYTNVNGELTSFGIDFIDDIDITVLTDVPKFPIIRPAQIGTKLISGTNINLDKDVGEKLLITYQLQSFSTEPIYLYEKFFKDNNLIKSPFDILTATGITSAKEYGIVSVGTTDFISIGASSNTVGVKFTANITSYPATSILTGKVYKIDSVGTTDFTLIGASANTVGTVFTATGVGIGTGTVTGNEGTGTAKIYNKSFKLYTTNETYNELDTTVKGSEDTSGTFSFANRNLTITPTGTYNAFALVDEDGDLIIACNSTIPRQILFSFKKERSDINAI